MPDGSRRRDRDRKSPAALAPVHSTLLPLWAQEGSSPPQGSPPNEARPCSRSVPPSPRYRIDTSANTTWQPPAKSANSRMAIPTFCLVEYRMGGGRASWKCVVFVSWNSTTGGVSLPLTVCIKRPRGVPCPARSALTPRGFPVLISPSIAACRFQRCARRGTTFPRFPYCCNPAPAG